MNEAQTRKDLIDKAIEVAGWKPENGYQELAVNRVLDAIAERQQRILLTLATGTGKTFIAFQIAWRLFKAKWTLQAAKGDGDFCVMRRAGGGNWEDKIVLVACRDAAEGGVASYVIKRAARSAAGVTLPSVNPDYAPLVIPDDAECGAGFQLVGEFKCVLGGRRKAGVR